MKIDKRIDLLEEKYNKALSEHDIDGAKYYLDIFNDIIIEINGQRFDVMIEPFSTDFNDYMDSLFDETTEIIKRWEGNCNYLIDDYITLDDKGDLLTFSYDEFYNVYDNDIFEWLKEIIKDYDIIINDNMTNILDRI